MSQGPPAPPGCAICGRLAEGACRFCGRPFCAAHGSARRLVCRTHGRLTLLVYAVAALTGAAVWWFFVRG